MAQAEPELQSFIGESFDSEEAVMVVLVLRDSAEPLRLQEVVARLQERFNVSHSEERRVVEKRVEIRLRDLFGHGLVGLVGDTYRYLGAEAGVDGLVEETGALLASRPHELNRILYSTSSRARRLAEAFRL